MILQFLFKNHKSFPDQQRLSLVASAALKDKLDAARVVKGLTERVLCVAAIYGGNASGKTNVLRALRFMQEAVCDSQRAWDPEGPINTSPFSLSTATQNASSRFELDFVVRGTRLRYGFELDRTQVLSEWLYAYPTGRRQVWFQRVDASSRIQFGKSLAGENRAIENLTRKNSLFLSAAAQNNHEQLTPVYAWFAEQLQLVDEPRQSLVLRTIQQCERDPEMRQIMLGLLRAADLGVIGFDMATVEVPPEFRSALRKAMEKVLPTLPELAEKFPETIPLPTLRHRSAEAPEGVALDFRSESAGTLALFTLLAPIVQMLRSGGVLLIDELDASLHPLLAMELVRLFNDQRRNPERAQLIFNTHDTNLLDKTVLRRDQIWFVEKDSGGASHLYPLTDFKPRKYENLERGYLQGRFGAVPFVGQLEPLEPTEAK